MYRLEYYFFYSHCWIIGGDIVYLLANNNYVDKDHQLSFGFTCEL